jgi:hypothetical protein
MTRPQTSYTLYDGPSRYDGSPILVTLALRSRNSKTGPMAQIYILPRDTSPCEAVKTGRDSCVCGNCTFRPVNRGGCYVAVAQAPQSAWRAAHKRGKVQLQAGLEALRKSGLSVRLGAYGDPAAVPPASVLDIAQAAGNKVTGYTHGHLTLHLASLGHLRALCMMSVETPAQASAAHSLGWRTFRVTTPDAPRLASETACPSARVTCAQCLRCGPYRPTAPSVTIPAHGHSTRKALAVVQ